MKVVNCFETLIDLKSKNPQKKINQLLQLDENLNQLYQMAKEWEIDLENVEKWMNSVPYEQNRKIALEFSSKIHLFIRKIESIFKTELPGEVCVCPSLMQYDGFARFDGGKHKVWFGVDHPDANENYLKVLLSHELSHVYRDHQPDVWGFLGKPLTQLSRNEYLEALSAHEHLLSEGLATLFSQYVFPDVELHVHHYYNENELKWCIDNKDVIEDAIMEELKKPEQNVWKFYEDDVIKLGSPSRTQYFWAAYKIREWIDKENKKKNLSMHELEQVILSLHGKNANFFENII